MDINIWTNQLYLENGINLLIGNQFGLSILGQFERANIFTRQTAIQVGK